MWSSHVLLFRIYPLAYWAKTVNVFLRVSFWYVSSGGWVFLFFVFVLVCVIRICDRDIRTSCPPFIYFSLNRGNRTFSVLQAKNCPAHPLLVDSVTCTPSHHRAVSSGGMPCGTWARLSSQWLLHLMENSVVNQEYSVCLLISNPQKPAVPKVFIAHIYRRVC